MSTTTVSNKALEAAAYELTEMDRWSAKWELFVVEQGYVAARYLLARALRHFCRANPDWTPKPEDWPQAPITTIRAGNDELVIMYSGLDGPRDAWHVDSVLGPVFSRMGYQFCRYFSPKELSTLKSFVEARMKDLPR